MPRTALLVTCLFAICVGAIPSFASDNTPNPFQSRVETRLADYPTLTTAVAKRWVQANSQCARVMERLLDERSTTSETTWNTIALGFGFVVVPVATAFSCVSDSDTCSRNAAIGVAAASGIATLASQLAKSSTAENVALSERAKGIRKTENVLSGQLVKLGPIEEDSETERTALELIGNYRMICIEADRF